MLVDTHCHLNFPPLCDNIASVLLRAEGAKVTRIVVPSYDITSFASVSALASKFSLFPAFGLHPWVADEALTKDFLEKWLRENNAAAVGEIGLDYKIENADRSRQQEICRMQLELAADLDLPVLLHCRGAFDELLALLAPFGKKLRGIVHAWSRSPELGMRFIEQGMHLGFGGAITRTQARHARQSATTLPLERIVLETDAPSIGLDGIPPAETEPAHVLPICRSLASLRNISFEEAALATTQNAEVLFTGMKMKH